MPRGLLAEWLLADVERAVDSLDVTLAHAAGGELAAQRWRVRRLHRAEAAIAAAIVRRADRTASGMRDRPKAGNAAHQYARRAAQLALDADAVGGRVWLARIQERSQHLQQLVLVDRAAVQLEIDIHVRLDRRRGGERVDEVGLRVYGLGELTHVAEIAQRLDPTGGGARADGDQSARLATHRVQTRRVVRRGDRAFHQRHVIRPAHN